VKKKLIALRGHTTDGKALHIYRRMNIPVLNSQVCLRMRWFYFLAIQQAALCLEKHNNQLYMSFHWRKLFNTFTASQSVRTTIAHNIYP